MTFSARLLFAPMTLALFAACSETNDTPNPISASDASDATSAETSADTNAPPIDSTPIDSGIPADSASTDAVHDADADVVTDAGTAADCLPASATDPFFTVMDASKCVVAQYTVPVSSLSSLTWGKHGGPLGFEGSSTSLVRYKVPSATSGALTVEKTAVTIPSLPSGIFWGSQAIDLPFFNWTAFGYTGTGAGFPGELVLTDGSALRRYHVNGFFAETAVGLTSGRIVYTGLSTIGTTATTTNEGAVYAADSCGSGGVHALLPEGDPSCAAPVKIATWEGGSSGPITADGRDDVFAILSTFGGKQELRGFEKSTIARGQGATAGVTMFSITGYTSELAADGNTVFYQSNDATTSTALDVSALDYTVDATSKKIVPAAAGSRTLIKLAKSGTSVALVVDDRSRLWVGISNPATGDAGPTSSTFFVLRDKTP